MMTVQGMVVGVLIIVCCCSLIGSSSSQEELMMQECLRVYNEGGAPAVLDSPECPRWNLSSKDETRRENCLKQHSFRLQGRRQYQEDRTFCALDLKIPFLSGRTGLKEVTVGMAAVFDGHNGAEASEMASRLLLDYFLLHLHFLHNEIYSVALEESMGNVLHKGEHGLDLERFKTMLPDGSHMEFLKESLLRAVHDIYVTFSKEALKNNLRAGSTANIVLTVDNHILVSNVGDSKAILCSEESQSPEDVKRTLLKLRQLKRTSSAAATLYEKFKMETSSSDGLKHFVVKELSRDHHPDRDDEKSRIESAGGFVETWGVPRVNGQLAVSRAIGDIDFKRYGVISTPEVTDWQTLNASDTYLVVASDGVFERMSTQDVCQVLWDADMEESLAELVVNTAFESGSTDNLSAVVLPLKLNERSMQ